MCLVWPVVWPLSYCRGSIDHLGRWAQSFAITNFFVARSLKLPHPSAS